MDTNNITSSKIIKILNTNNITNMSKNNDQLKFNSVIYKGKTYKEISEDREGLNNIFKSNSPGYNKFKIWYNNNLDREEKKYEPERRIRINDLIESNDAYELRLINKKVHGTGLTTLNYSSKINNDVNLRNLDFLENLLYGKYFCSEEPYLSQ